jgi:hypothetical protein
MFLIAKIAAMVSEPAYIDKTCAGTINNLPRKIPFLIVAFFQ